LTCARACRRQQAKEKHSILEDIDFELVLVHRDEINVAYILKLLARLKADEHTAKGEAMRKQIMSLLSSDVELRSKRELIEKFIAEHLPKITDADPGKRVDHPAGPVGHEAPEQFGTFAGWPHCCRRGARMVHREEQAHGNIWLVPVAGGEPRKLTTAQASDGSPVWSPDGKPHRIRIQTRRGQGRRALCDPHRWRRGGEDPRTALRDFQPALDARWESVIMATTCIPGIGGQLEQGEHRRHGEGDQAPQGCEDDGQGDGGPPLPLLRSLAHGYLAKQVAAGECRHQGDQGPYTRSGTACSRPAAPWTSTFRRTAAQVALVVNTTPPPYSGFLNNDVHLVPTDGSGTLRNVTTDNVRHDSDPTFAPDGRSMCSRDDDPLRKRRGGQVVAA
jgi:hypothetical protein